MATAAPKRPLDRFLSLFVTRAVVPQAARDSSPTASPGPVLGRESWNLGGLNELSPYYHVPVTANFPLYERLQEAVPLIDAAIVHSIEAIGCPCVEAEEDVKADIDDWLQNRLIVNRVQVGIGPFMEAYIGNLLTYGRAHAEITLTNRRDDIYSLTQLHPGTIAFKPGGDGVTMETVQLGRIQPLVFPPWKVLNAVNRVRGDDPNGTSLLWGLSIVAECYIAMVRSQQGLYTRFGDPSYHVNVEPPEGLNDPNGAIMGRLVASNRTAFQDAIAARKDGKTKDFFSGGTVKVEVIGAAGEELNFTQSAQSMCEQIVAKTGLPPLIFGLPWSTTERMSSVQSGLLAEMVDRYQAVLNPPLTRLITLRQQLAGKPTDFKLTWDGANLMDRLQDAQADEQEETARAAAWENDLKLRKQGMLTPIEWVKRCRPDLADLDEANLMAKLPEFDPDPPEEAPPVPIGGPQNVPNNRQPGNGRGPGNNRPPAVARSLTYDEGWTNGNGNGH